MHRLLRRILGMGPSPSEVTIAAGRIHTNLIVEGLKDPRPLTAEEMDRLMDYTGSVARRSFSTLYDDPQPGDPCPKCGARRIHAEEGSEGGWYLYCPAPGCHWCGDTQQQTS